MNDQHAREAEQFAAVLRACQGSRIDERLLILDVFLSTERHLTLADVEEMLRQRGVAAPDRAFLQETMDLLCHFGFAKRRVFDLQEARYEHEHLGLHHDHFICTRCGRIQEFSSPELERLQLEIARDYQFHPLHHKNEVYGLCQACNDERTPTMPLALASIGEEVRIARIRGGREIQSRLAAMGLHVGLWIEVIQRDAPGPFIVAAKGTRLALGHGLAGKIEVSPAREAGRP
ncbi:MAG: transcriptional repressor [Thermodesulfobacteriota bacterium]